MSQEPPSPFTLPTPTYEFVGIPKPDPQLLTLGLLIKNLRGFADYYDSATQEIEQLRKAGNWAMVKYESAGRDANASADIERFRAMKDIDRIRALCLSKYGSELTISTAQKLLGELTIQSLSLSQAENMLLGEVADILKANDARLSTLPTGSKEPPASLAEPARLDLPGLFNDLQPEKVGAIPDGEKAVKYSTLLTALTRAGHTRSTGEWAIHWHVVAGHLSAQPRRTSTPAVWADGGWKLEARTVTTYDRFECLLISTPNLYLWWAGCEAGPQPSERTRTKPKRSPEKGDARLKLIAALTKHHRYAEEAALNLEPIGNNALARAANVAPSVASSFFKTEFKGHKQYAERCRQHLTLLTALKLLNNEFAPHCLYGKTPTSDGCHDAD